jgi:nucleoid DNA-binding protein
MDELIKQVVEKLGLDQEVVNKAIGAVLKFMKDHAGKDIDFANEILNKLPGAETLVKDADKPLPPESAPRANSEGGGATSLLMAIINFIFNSPIMDIIKKLLGMVFGEGAVKMIDSAGGGVEVAGIMNKLGISQEQGTQIVSMLISFMKNKVGADTVDKIISEIPAVKAFLNSSKKDE